MRILKPGDDVACAKRRGFDPYNVLGKFSSIILSSGVCETQQETTLCGGVMWRSLYPKLARGREVCATGLSDRRLKIEGLSPLIRTPIEGTSI